jgi:hypothetical protein
MCKGKRLSVYKRIKKDVILRKKRVCICEVKREGEKSVCARERERGRERE